MVEDLKIIKKHYGESIMKFCRTQFSTILEEPGLLPKLLISNFEPNHSLYEDLDVYGNFGGFKNYIYNKTKETKNIGVKDNVKKEVKSPEELMFKAGYVLYQCKTEEDIQRFKKYYKKDEELCTFNGGRLRRCHVFFAVKRNVNLVKRKDFSKPQRQDEYGTSVISIQFTKDENHTLSIKNRYNHTVVNPDATFSNNLDNIIPGLTESFEKYYGLHQKEINEFELPGYVRANDGKYYKYNYEIDNIYYCPNNIIIDNFEAKRLVKEKYILLDYFILDLQQKKIRLYDKIEDSFVKSIPNIKKIEVRNIKESKEKEIIIFSKNNNNTKITIDRNNNMVGFVNNSLVKIENYFLHKSEKLRIFEAQNVLKIGISFLERNQELDRFICPKVRKIDGWFLSFNKKLREFSALYLKKLGPWALTNNEELTTFRCPNLRDVGDNSLRKCEKITVFDAPHIEKKINFYVLNKYIRELVSKRRNSKKECLNEEINHFRNK